MNIFVTGGLGFIGSHTVIELIKNNHTVIIADNLINSKIEVLDKLSTITGIRPTFYQIDVTDEAKIEEIFSSHKIDGVSHFADLKAVGDLFQWKVDGQLKYSEIEVKKMLKAGDLSRRCEQIEINILMN